jgi:hypothetical protein
MILRAAEGLSSTSWLTILACNSQKVNTLFLRHHVTAAVSRVRRGAALPNVVLLAARQLLPLGVEAFLESRREFVGFHLAAAENRTLVIPQRPEIKRLAHKEHPQLVLRAAVELSGHDSILLPLAAKMPDYRRLFHTIPT